MNTELERQKIQEVIAAWLQASKSGDTDSLLRLMAADVVFLLPGQEPMRGRSAFAAASQSSGRKFRLVDAAPEIHEIHIAGDFAICWSHLEVSLAAQEDGKIHHHSGNILTVFRREPDDQWVIFRDANLLTPRKDA